MNFQEFTAKANEVEGELGFELYHVDTDGNQNSFQDDGILHVVVGKFRAAFDIEEFSASKQNENANKIMKAFGLTVTNRVLT